MRPYLVILERAFGSLLPERQFVTFNGDAVVRADLKTRFEVYEIANRIGLLSINEERAKENLEPVPGGDGHIPAQLMQQAQSPAETSPADVRPIRRVQ